MQVKGADRYRPDMLPALEKAVDEQAAGAKPFSLDVSLAVLRLYALQPSVARPETVARILLRALAQLPAADYRTCAYLVPERMQADEPLSSIVLLASHLESGRLADFWALAHGSRDMLAMVPGFMDEARRFVAHTLAITFARLPKRQLGDALRLEGRELDAYVAERVQRDGWTLAAGDAVVLPRNEHNTPSVRRAAEVVALDAVLPALMAA
ncbi:eukaryotic translation initiation factor 3 subunit K [Raphidocelis subcapitata]|uniref:Eukaryotic translation initiation factor 3 subunit K n=1 Tax=Raphidocelis subcapitata TaxID=307507 RepID=A0A2V0PMQ7_9CHLO|nr:eukaryotic translation initiation factor 3 subunit K [Raphidocelis subcapitata]|eukprot:GBF99180.1 eukaryotic translation initiation factor 3 subunit K [Raphidocelis subcapitata]